MQRAQKGQGEETKRCTSEHALFEELCGAFVAAGRIDIGRLFGVLEDLSLRREWSFRWRHRRQVKGHRGWRYRAQDNRCLAIASAAWALCRLQRRQKLGAWRRGRPLPRAASSAAAAAAAGLQPASHRLHAPRSNQHPAEIFAALLGCDTCSPG